MDTDIAREVNAAFEFAESSPYPDPASAYALLYAEPVSADDAGH
jgi:TPP-dependent pyruvate/acetoin dehydrogenase alpha subunit